MRSRDMALSRLLPPQSYRKMRIMKKLTEAEERKLWEEVRREFPDDEVMQQVHFVRLVHHLQMRDLSVQERIDWLNQLPKAA